MARCAEVKQFPIIPCNLCGSPGKSATPSNESHDRRMEQEKGWVENMARHGRSRRRRI